MPPFLLTVLKIAFLLLLYFFLYRAVRAVVLDLYTGRQRATQQRTRPARRGKPLPTRLVVIDERGSKAGSHRLDGTVQIGRAPSCDIRPEDTYLSQHHARVLERNGTWYVEDMGSTNGTYLNQRKVTAPAEISPGDRIRVGKTTIEVRK